MTYTEAQSEFHVRLYRWAQAALAMELEESFPSFRFCREWPTRRCLFLRSLDPDSRNLFAQALLLQSHPEAAKVLGEAVSEAQAALMRREEGFRLRTSPGTWEGRFASVNAAKQSALATRKQLKRAIREHFGVAFGDRCLPRDPLDGKSDVTFRMSCRGWIIKIGFDFGRWDPEITCDQSIWTGQWITKDKPAILFANCIGFGLNYGNVLGIGSGWENIAVHNLDAVCAEIVLHCRRLLDAFPELLAGLELESLTA